MTKKKDSKQDNSGLRFGKDGYPILEGLGLCKCACHNTEWNGPNLHAPVEHDRKCCDFMNGYVKPPTINDGISNTDQTSNPTLDNELESILDDLRYDIEDVCDDKYVGWVKPIEELSGKIDKLKLEAKQAIKSLILEERKKARLSEIHQLTTRANNLQLAYDIKTIGYLNNRIHQLTNEEELMK